MEHKNQHSAAAASAPISLEFLPWKCYRSVARVDLDQISPVSLVGSSSFWFLLLTCGAGTNSRVNSQGDSNKKGEKITEVGQVCCFTEGINTVNFLWVNLRKRKNKVSAMFWGEKSQVRLRIFMRREKIW